MFNTSQISCNNPAPPEVYGTTGFSAGTDKKYWSIPQLGSIAGPIIRGEGSLMLGNFDIPWSQSIQMIF
jgi:hypothetical protein